MKKMNMFLVVVLSVLLVFPPNVMAEMIGSLTCIEGRVDRLDKAVGEYLPLVVGDEVSLGDVIRTKSYSKAEITFEDASVLRLGDSSQIRIKDYAIDENGLRENSVIGLDRGQIRAIVAKTPDKTPFDVETPNATGRVKGSDIFVSFQHSATNVLVAEGVLNMSNPAFPDQFIDLKDGMTALVPYNAPPKDPRAFLPEEMNKWEEHTSPAIRTMEGVSADAEFTKAIVAKIAGTVRVQPRGSKKWHAPVAKESLNAGDKVETGKSGMMLLTFDNGLSIELRPSTQLMITQLKRDPKTGDYDNRFESGYGKLVAKLQNLPEKSTFKVKTPHAVCGIRGTIMYLDVSPTFTKSFFEGGSGYLEDTVNKVMKIIKAGVTAVVNSDGNFSESETSDADRAGFGGGFGNEGGGEYGYTDPGDDVVDVPEGGDEAKDTGGGTDVPRSDDGNAPFNEVTPDPTDVPSWNGAATPAGPQMIVKGVEGDGYFQRYYYNNVLEEKYLQGGPYASSFSPTCRIPVTEGRWGDTTTIGSVSAIGISHDGIPKMFWSSVDGYSSVGGETSGWLVGIKKESGINKTWRGSFAGIYVDPQSNLGVIRGRIDGTLDEDHFVSDTIEFGGSGIFNFLENDGILLPQTSQEGLSSRIVETKGEPTDVDVFVPGEGNTIDWMKTIHWQKHIEGANWGITKSTCNGKYLGSDESQSWAGVSGSYFSDSTEPVSATFFYPGDGNPYENERYSINAYEFETTDDPYDLYSDVVGGFISINVAGLYMDYDTIVASTDVMDGRYKDWGITIFPFEAAGTGMYESTPLQFVTVFKATRCGEISLFEEGGLDASVEGYSGMRGLVGGDESIWSGDGPAYITYIGKYDPNRWGTNPGSTIWGGDFYSYDHNDGSYTTYDGGAYRGEMLGVHSDSIAAGIAAFYVDNDGNTGYLLGDLTGESSPGIGFFIADGFFDPTQKDFGDGVEPGDLNDYYDENVTSDTMFGFGETRDGSDSLLGAMLGTSLSLDNTSWGLWVSTFYGVADHKLSDSWRLPIAGFALDDYFYHAILYPVDSSRALYKLNVAYLGVADGFTSPTDGSVSAGFNGFWLAPRGEENGIVMGTLSGEFEGSSEFVEAGEGFDETTFETAGRGTWVEVEELFDLDDLTELIEEVTEFDVFPTTITETLTGSGYGGVTSAAMDLTFYSSGAQDLMGIWAALFSGTYNIDESPSGGDWGAEFTDVANDVSVALEGVEWSQGEWSATVVGDVGNNNMMGAAAGTYGDGNFSGTGAGVWEDNSVSGGTGGQGDLDDSYS